MTTIDDITSEVYGALAGDDTLAGLAAVYKGGKRPAKARNPAITVEAGRLERGGGEGVWMCDVNLTIFADLLAEKSTDHATHDAILRRVREVLADCTLDLPGANAMPLIEDESGGPVWDGDRAGETKQEIVYGLVFVKFA